MVFRLSEGLGLAFYELGVNDSGHVLGISCEEMMETLIAVFHEAKTLRPPAKLSLEKVRKGYEGFGLRLKIER